MRALGTRVNEQQIQSDYCMLDNCDRIGSVCDKRCNHNHIEIKKREKKPFTNVNI